MPTQTTRYRNGSQITEASPSPTEQMNSCIRYPGSPREVSFVRVKCAQQSATQESNRILQQCRRTKAFVGVGANSRFLYCVALFQRRKKEHGIALLLPTISKMEPPEGQLAQNTTKPEDSAVTSRALFLRTHWLVELRHRK